LSVKALVVVLKAESVTRTVKEEALGTVGVVIVPIVPVVGLSAKSACSVPESIAQV
jgi:hypothetical protein